jgi:hypothetical protein
MLFLVTCHEIQTDIPLVFLIESSSRQRAKAVVKRDCHERGMEVVNYMHTHMLGNPGRDFYAPVRIDNLLPRLNYE